MTERIDGKAIARRIRAGVAADVAAAFGGSARPLADPMMAAAAGAWCARVHRVPGNADAVRVVPHQAQHVGGAQLPVKGPAHHPERRR